MDRSFFLPIAVAAGVHSLLFISGTPTTNPPHKPSDSRAVSWNPPPPIPLDLLDPPPAETTTGEKPSATKPPPISDERLTTMPDPKDFVQAAKLEDLRPRPSSDINTIESGWESIARSGTGTNAGPFDSINLDNNPMARFQPAPVYPQDLKPTGADGEVTVTFSVDVNGEVFNATVIRASHTRFGEEVLRAVKRWRFEPGIKNGKRVAFRMVQNFSFTLSE
jgi:protein TonB